jgi:hypothetical protein
MPLLVYKVTPVRTDLDRANRVSVGPLDLVHMSSRGSSKTNAGSKPIEVEHFIHCVQTGEELLTSSRAQRRPLEIVLAAYQSVETGLPVEL